MVDLGLREKLINEGIHSFSNNELLALMIGSGIKGKSYYQIACELLNNYNDALSDLDHKELAKIKGIGPVKAMKLQASFEFGRRFFQDRTHDLRLLSPEQIACCVSEITVYKQEHCIGLYLDSRYQLIRKVVLSKGTLTESLLHPREVFYESIQAHAATVIIAHNHPSGDPSPSEEDIYLTKQLSQAGKIMGIPLLDHVIVTKGNFLSLKELHVID